jgi:hypothetical protein
MKALDRNHVIAWLKSEAKKLLDAAEALEGGQGTHSVAARRNGTTNGHASRTFSPEAMRERLEESGARVSDIAKYFGVSPDQVKAVIDEPANGIRVASRGWLKLSRNEKTEGGHPSGFS